MRELWCAATRARLAARCRPTGADRKRSARLTLPSPASGSLAGEDSEWRFDACRRCGVGARPLLDERGDLGLGGLAGRRLGELEGELAVGDLDADQAALGKLA